MSEHESKAPLLSPGAYQSANSGNYGSGREGNHSLDSEGTIHTPLGHYIKRKCLSSYCLYFQLGFNVWMMFLNTFLIGVDSYYIYMGKSDLLIDQSWFIALDVFVVVVLVIDFCARLWIEHLCDIAEYMRENTARLDAVVVVLSVAALTLYIYEQKEHSVSRSAEAETMLLILRILRDIVRLARTISFVQMFMQSLSELRLGNSDLSYESGSEGEDREERDEKRRRFLRSVGLDSPKLDRGYHFESKSSKRALFFKAGPPMSPKVKPGTSPSFSPMKY